MNTATIDRLIHKSVFINKTGMSFYWYTFQSADDMFFNWHLRLRPTRYAISSLTAKESWKWITVRCSCPMTCTSWRKKRSGSTTHRYRPTNRRLTSISSTASGRCSRFHSHSTMMIIDNNCLRMNILKTFSKILLGVFL